MKAIKGRKGYMYSVELPRNEYEVNLMNAFWVCHQHMDKLDCGLTGDWRREPALAWCYLTATLGQHDNSYRACRV